MRIISRKQICDFALKHPECSSGLDAWDRIMKHTNYSSFTELRKTFKSADQVGKLTVLILVGIRQD